MHKDTIKYGVGLGIFSIILTTVFYFVNPKMLFQTMNAKGAIGIVVTIGVMYMAAKKARDRNGGFIPFGEALVPAFVTSVIDTLMVGTFAYVLYNFIDPSLLETMKESVVESQRYMLETAGMSEAQIVEALEKAEEQQGDMDPSSLSTTVLGLLISMITMSLPIAAIIAAIVKKKEPMPVV